MVSEILVKTYNNHPGTNNFGARLNEAKRIHYENRFLASRLDHVQPYYQFTKLQNSPKKKAIKLKRPPNAKMKKNEYKTPSKNVVINSNSNPSSPRSVRTAPQGNKRADFDDARKQISSVGGKRPGAPVKPKNLIMEHWKIQDGRVLDVAVLKEPFEDRFSILGIDVDNGQRYQLSLSSEEVSNILEGDMLVTSFDNHNVWLALIEKVNLRPVMAFVKPGSAPIAVTATVSVVNDSKHLEDSAVSSLTGQPANEFISLSETIISHQEDDKSQITLTEDWGSLNMPAIDVPISNYGPDPDYDDAFEDADDGDDSLLTKTKKDTDDGNGDGLPSINLSISGNDDSTGVEAAPPPFELPSTRPSRPMTAGNGNRGSSTSVGADAVEGRGRKDSALAIIVQATVDPSMDAAAKLSAAQPAPVEPVSAHEKDMGDEAHEEDMGDKTFSVSTTANSRASAGTDISVDMSDGEGEYRKPTPTRTSGSKPAAKSAGGRKSPGNGRASLLSKNDKISTPPLDNVPWNSNVLVTRVHERMAEISAVEQEASVKRRATEYKQKKAELQSKTNNVIASPPKVSFKPEPPPDPRPSGLQGDINGSFKSVRGRRPTSIASKDEALSVTKDDGVKEVI